jgi:hypothetical protein
VPLDILRRVREREAELANPFDIGHQGDDSAGAILENEWSLSVPLRQRSRNKPHQKPKPTPQ